MKAVVMAGGEGTRLRPLTSNQPKPMVPIVGKPCMEHILELLRSHGFGDVLITVVHAPGDQVVLRHRREPPGMNIEYSVEESPLGTAGSRSNWRVAASAAPASSSRATHSATSTSLGSSSSIARRVRP